MLVQTLTREASRAAASTAQNARDAAEISSGGAGAESSSPAPQGSTRSHAPSATQVGEEETRTDWLD